MKYLKTMYTDEYLPEDALEYFDNISIKDSSSINTEIRENRKQTEVFKRSDKDFYSYKRKVFVNGEGSRVVKIEAYSSPLLSNGFIRNAVTGNRMEHRVGSKYEDLYFKLMDVCPGNHTPLNNLPRKLFYDNPEQCERHLYRPISKDIKEKWLEKNLLARSRFCRV